MEMGDVITQALACQSHQLINKTFSVTEAHDNVAPAGAVRVLRRRHPPTFSLIIIYISAVAFAASADVDVHSD